jgi:uncharacterized protein (DUF2141 family)
MNRWAVGLLTSAALAVGAAPRMQVAGTLSGIVVDSAGGGQPVPRAWVSVKDPTAGVSQATVTDERGRFSFERLPTGRYALTASKPAFVTSEYGARLPGREGTPVSVGAGGRLTGLQLVMPRGGVLAGVVRDPAGDPASGLSLTLFARKFTKGLRRLVALPSGFGFMKTVVTDDRGAFRFFGLTPGEYVIAADPPRNTRNPIRQVTAEDVARARRLLAGQRAGGAAGTIVASPPPGRGRGPASYARIYYPGTPAQSEALPVAVAAGEERTGLDFALRFITTARVEGRVVNLPADAADSILSVSLLNRESSTGVGRTAGSGTFQIQNVAPGRYVLRARLTPRRLPDSPDLPADAVRYWGTTELVVGDDDVTAVTVVLEPDIPIDMTVTFDGAPDSPKPASVIVTLFPNPPLEEAGSIDPAVSVSGGEHATLRAAPGRYTVSVSTRTAGGLDTTWATEALSWNGARLADDAVDISSGERPRLEVTLSDRPTQLSGVIQDRAGRPAPDYFVVVFSTDRERWTWMSRAVKAARPDTDGRFVIRGLPPGQYLMAAMTSIDENEWFDPDLLEQLMPGAIPVALTAGASATQDVRIGG